MSNQIDQDALAIGLSYQKAQASELCERVFHLGDAGLLLLKKKESLGYGQWSGWLKANQGTLGFGDRGARTLIHGAQWLASNWKLANKLEDIITDPLASAEDLIAADQIRQLISGQFQPVVRGTLGRRTQNEWYTPRHVITRARNVLGTIDLDPASSEQAQETVRARQYFDKHQNGLLQDWCGRVWLNPPYAPPLIGKFVAKLLMEWDSGRIASCIALTHNYTDAIWFHDCISAADAVCFTQGRIRFHEPGGAVANPTQGQAFFYFGNEVDAFKQEFGRVGFIVRPEPDSWLRRRVRDGQTEQQQNRRPIDANSDFG
jgi:phage N-6-adenine-methyltransferase